jgi:uncharacterized membrane protein YgcG
MAYAMSLSCKRPADDRPQFQKLAMVMLIICVFGLFLMAVSSIATQDRELPSNSGLFGAQQIVLGVLFLCAFIPFATMNPKEGHNQIAFWVTFLIVVYGWALLILIGRFSADDKVGGCTDASLEPCRIIGLATAGSVLVVLAETFMLIFIFSYSRGSSGGGGGGSSGGDGSNQSSG